MRTTARRRFLKSLAVAPLMPAAGALVPQAAAPPTPATPTPSPSASASAPGSMAWALTEAARHRFGSQLTAEEVAEIAKGVESNLQAASRLRERMRHGNADEPVTVFEARPTAPPSPEAPPARPGRRGRR